MGADDDYEALETWMSEVAGLTGQDLMEVMRVCIAEDIECVDDVKLMFDRQQLHAVGFSPTAMSKMVNVLSS